ITSRRLMISSLIKAATLTPISMISQENSVVPRPVSSLSSRALARWPVTKTRRSAIQFRLTLADRRFQVGQRFDDAGSFEGFQPLGVLQVDLAWIDLDHAVRRHGF